METGIECYGSSHSMTEVFFFKKRKEKKKVAYLCGATVNGRSRYWRICTEWNILISFLLLLVTLI